MSGIVVCDGIHNVACVVCDCFHKLRFCGWCVVCVAVCGVGCAVGGVRGSVG